MSGGAGPGDDLRTEEKRLLLQVARAALQCHFRGERPSLPPATGALAEPLGAFVTLVTREAGELRGCVGLMAAEEPLLETVARTAVAAGTRDGRFDPVTEGELPRLFVEISVLGPMTPVRPEQVEVGRHGLLVVSGRRRGVLLPQVAVEQGWNRERFLSRTCWKAGLPEDAWRQPDVELFGFTATVFGEHEASA